MSIKKIMTLFLAMMMFAILSVGCTEAEQSIVEPDRGDADQQTQDISSDDPTDDPTIEVIDIDDDYDDVDDYAYTPSVPVLDGLPVYPGGQMYMELPGQAGNSWSWVYMTTASANEIVAYFTEVFEDLGFEIDEEGTFALFEEFFVATTDNVVSVYWMGSDESDIDPDTPNRGYGIMVDLDAWPS